MFVSFITTVKTLGNNVSRTHGDDAESDCVCDSVSNVDENNEVVDEQDDVEDDKTDEDEKDGDNEDGDGYDDYQCDDGSMGEVPSILLLMVVKVVAKIMITTSGTMKL